MTHITQSQRESYLSGAAILLRGYTDAGDYKQFIFPRLFFKRMCDVYDEEYAEALKESGGDEGITARHFSCFWVICRKKIVTFAGHPRPI